MLQHIKETKCPSCGAAVRSELREHQHCNGHWNEYRKFECGHELHFSPNFMKVSVSHECKRSPAAVARTKARRDAVAQTAAFINSLATDDDFKKSLRETVQRVSVEAW